MVHPRPVLARRAGPGRLIYLSQVGASHHGKHVLRLFRVTAWSRVRALCGISVRSPTAGRGQVEHRSWSPVSPEEERLLDLHRGVELLAILELKAVRPRPAFDRRVPNDDPLAGEWTARLGRDPQYAGLRLRPVDRGVRITMPAAGLITCWVDQRYRSRLPHDR